jgi:hypothetical protein
MRKNKLWMVLVALAFGAVAQTSGPTVTVTVNPSTGAISVSPTTVVVVQSDNAVTWSLTSTKNYRFASSGGVSMPSSAGYACANDTSNSQVVCTRVTRSVGSFAYTLNVVPVGAAVPAGVSPNAWVQND